MRGRENASEPSFACTNSHTSTRTSLSTQAAVFKRCESG